jgi:hypothetical protein
MTTTGTGCARSWPSSKPCSANAATRSLERSRHDAVATGKDLVRDMVGRLKRDILVATNRLDAIRPPPA